MSKFRHLEMLAARMGFGMITLEFMEAMAKEPGSIRRKAHMCGMSDVAGDEAKKEFDLFMKQGREMFAPVNTSATAKE